MKKAKITFIPMDGTGALHLDFQPGPFGDAIEAKRGGGVGFFSQNGDLQGATFDDVDEKEDQQVLEFDRYRIEVTVRKGKISHLVVPKKPSRISRKSAKDAA